MRPAVAERYLTSGTATSISPVRGAYRNRKPIACGGFSVARGETVSRFDISNRTMLICADATASVVTDNGRCFDVPGIFDNAEREVEHGREGTSSGGGMTYKIRQPVFTSADKAFTGINKSWRLMIRGKSYFCAEPQYDGAGWVTLWLADSVDDLTPEQIFAGSGNGGIWR
jgi:hypothetical protein